MKCKVIRSGKASLTNFAFEWLGPGVFAIMPRQFVRTGKSPLALGKMARIWLLSWNQKQINCLSCHKILPHFKNADPSKVSQWSRKGTSKVCQKSFKGSSMVHQRSLKGPSKVCQRSVKGLSKVRQKSLKVGYTGYEYILNTFFVKEEG